MPASLLWHPEAEDDLIDIYVTISRDHPSAAERIFEAIETKIALLTDYPRMGPRRDDITRGVRILVERPYMVI